MFACKDTETTQKPPEASTPPVKSEPLKSEPLKSDSDKPETVKSDPAKTDPAKTDPNKTDPVKTDPNKTDPAKPAKLVKEVPLAVQAFFDDPEIQLLGKTSDELETEANNLVAEFRAREKSITGDTLKKFVTEKLFPVLIIRILQKNDDLATKNISVLLAHGDIPMAAQLIKDMKAKGDKIASRLSADLSSVNDNTKDAYAKLSDISFDFASLIGKIKGKISAQAALENIALPSDF